MGVEEGRDIKSLEENKGMAAWADMNCRVRPAQTVGDGHDD